MNSGLSPRSLVQLFAYGSMIIGGLLMFASFLFLASSGPRDLMAGQSGLIAGAILTGSGVVALSILASEPRSPDNNRERNES